MHHRDAGKTVIEVFVSSLLRIPPVPSQTQELTAFLQITESTLLFPSKYEIHWTNPLNATH